MRRIAPVSLIVWALAMASGPARLSAQVTTPPTRADTGRPRPQVQGGAKVIDSATAKRLGLPTAPRYALPEPDSVMRALIGLKGFAVTRFRSDSAILQATEQTILLGGHAATKREDGVLEADQIFYDDKRCLVSAIGEPQLFQGANIITGTPISFATCGDERAVIGTAFTSFSDLGATWFIRGHMAIDSSAKRMFVGGGEFTSCDLPEPHYHFSASEVKWVSQSVIVARPAVLYVRDVPIAWLPFVFQDTKPGRRSGILIPQLGFNDIVRPTVGYNRQVTNVGYYWAPNDYIDLTGRLDWYANRYLQYGLDLRYKWLNRFVQDGSGISFSKQEQDGGGSSTIFHWNHAQQFNVRTTLRLEMNYVSNTTILQSNVIDPLQSTQQISSALNYTKRYKWGSVTVGGNRRVTLSDGSGTMTLPSLAISPKSFSIATGVTLSPSFTVTNNTQFNIAQPTQQIATGIGGLDSLVTKGRSRTTSASLTLPIDVKGFTISNSFQFNDLSTVARKVVTTRVPDLSTPDPNDSLTINEFRDGDFASGIDVNFGFSLPTLMRNTFKLVPTIGITNRTSGTFLLRSPGSDGMWESQGKKLLIGISAAPSLYGFLYKGIGPAVRFRHTIQPSMSFNWSPETSIPIGYARALSGSKFTTTPAPIPASMSAILTLHQTLEAKVHPTGNDTTSDKAKWPNKKLIEISTGSIEYDFEQAKLPHRTGWKTSTLTNSFQSELLPGFQFSLTHSLWDGQVGTDTAKFSPYITNVQANFSLTGRTLRSLASIFGLVHADDPNAGSAPSGPIPVGGIVPGFRPGAFGTSNAALPPPGRGFTASINYSLQRQRPTGNVLTTTNNGLPTDPFSGPPLQSFTAPPTQTNIGLNMSFSPTTFWSLSWVTQYNVTAGRFESQQIQLQRDLHDWRASFNFAKAPTGNFALYFSVFLLHLPDLKFDYNQTTLQQTKQP